jgi:hypothetical protein
MAKRHHSSSSSVSSKRDKFNDEHHHSKNSYKMGGYYEGETSRRRQEMEDAGMIREDHSAVANLPQNVMMKPYPKEGGYLPEDLDDTLRGIDRQMGYDNGKKMQHFYPKKV